MSEEMQFKEDGKIHFEVTRYQRRRTLFYVSLAEFCYVRSMRPSSKMPNVWRGLGDFFTRRVFFFSEGGIPIPRDKKHTNALREHVGMPVLERRHDELNSMTADWVRRSNVPDQEQHLEQEQFERFAESIARK
jgi:hypothetical protein